MPRIASLSTFILLAGVVAFGAGCVPQSQYDSLVTANQSLEERLIRSEDERKAVEAANGQLQHQLRQVRQDLSSQQTLNRSMQGNIDELSRDYEEMYSRVSVLDLGPLPMDVEDQLRDLAKQYSDVLTFDASQGMVQFASDFTFGSGSVQLSDHAQRSIKALAQVLRSDSAVQLEVRIVGHTDNVRIGKPETKRMHPTNRHLSVHRAISVGDALTASGVTHERIMVAGFGEHRPIVPNGRNGAQENRRVEIYLTPMPDYTYSARGAQPMYTDEPSGPESGTPTRDMDDNPMK